MKKFLKLFTPFISGAVFGAVNVIPGVSSGTMLVVFGCYDIICGALALDFGHIKKHLYFLVPFAFGAVAGLGGAIFAAAFLLENFPIPTFLFFIGLITGSLPLIFKNLHAKGKPKNLHILLGGIALALIIALGFIPEPETTETTGFALILISSFTAAAAMIIPGISGAFIFLLFGTYYTITNAVRELDFSVIIPAVIGIAAGVVLGARGIKLLLAKLYTASYSVITGLVLGSLFAVFPENVQPNATLAAGVCTFAAGAGITLLAGRANKTEKQG
jgi:putative membrane protein